MSRFTRTQIKKKPDRIEAQITRNADVDILFETDGIRFMVSFGFKLPQGTNNFPQLTEMIDLEIMTARNEIIKKVARKLGAKVNFEN